MTDRYKEWRDFYAEKVRSWMSLEELRAECGKLTTTDAPSPEVLLIHAMHALEERDMQQQAGTSWNRGFQQGLEANRLLATQAMDALKKEREAHAETNRAMTDALLMMEEREQRDEALLRQALEALEYYRSGEDYQPTPASEAIIAIKERLK